MDKKYLIRVRCHLFEAFEVCTIWTIDNTALGLAREISNDFYYQTQTRVTKWGLIKSFTRYVMLQTTLKSILFLYDSTHTLIFVWDIRNGIMEYEL